MKNNQDSLKTSQQILNNTHTSKFDEQFAKVDTKLFLYNTKFQTELGPRLDLHSAISNAVNNGYLCLELHK